MRNFIISLFAILPFISYGQKSEIVIDSVDSKDVIYSKSLLWVTNSWKSANNVIQLQDVASGTIVVKGGLSPVPRTMGVPGDGISMTNVTIVTKDGKAKISFDNTNFSWRSGQVWTLEKKPAMTGRIYDKWKGSILLEIDALIQSYKTALLKEKDDF